MNGGIFCRLRYSYIPFTRYLQVLLILLILIFSGCRVSKQETGESIIGQQNQKESIAADVILVEVTGEDGKYQFSVGIKSPDTGCDQYANWWEVLTEDGNLLYRRILAHSHTNEQPFIRSGGPVGIAKDTIVIIRAHMNTTGYGGKAMKGTVKNGFDEIDIDPDFAFEVENKEPQPEDCAF